MNIEEKFDELCYKIEGVDLNYDCIPEFHSIIKSWNLPLIAVEALISHCQKLANKVNDRFWNIDRSSSSYTSARWQETPEVTIRYIQVPAINLDDIDEIDF